MKYFICILIGLMLTACNDSSRYVVTKITGVSNCGNKFSYFRYIDATGQMQSMPVFHGTTITSKEGITYRSPHIGEACNNSLEELRVN